jgi:hypothetical protein
MTGGFVAYDCGGLLSAGLFLASGWAYWHEQLSDDRWVAQPAEQIVAGAAAGQELHVPFTLRNISSGPKRILGVEAC